VPELPEVETMRRGVLSVVGSVVRDVARPPCAKRPIEVRPRIDLFRRRATGAQITGVGRIGKRVILELSTDDRIILEPRMTGLVLLADPPTAEHLRLRIELSGGPDPELLFWDRRGLGSVRLLSPDEMASELGPEKIGVDALSIGWQGLRTALAQSRRAIKVALLDQKAVAGVGNLYASELLHMAQVHPERACHTLKPAEWQAIHDAMVMILEEAIRYEGSTLSDGTYRNAQNKDGSYQNQHRVYDKAGNACPRCVKELVVRIVQAQRSTFFCPACQRKSKRR